MSGILQALVIGGGATQIEFVGAGSTATSASNTLTVPTGVQSGDLLFIICAAGGSLTLTSATGWTQAASLGGGSLRTQMWWKVAGASESSNSFTSTNSRMRAVMLAYRRTAASPVDVTPATGASGSSTSAATASLTTTAANDLVIGYATTSSSASYTAPASVNERYNVACDGTINGLIVWDEIQAAIGASSVRTATLSVSTNWLTYSAAFKQA